jgi:hypothetical protein
LFLMCLLKLRQHMKLLIGLVKFAPERHNPALMRDA